MSQKTTPPQVSIIKYKLADISSWQLYKDRVAIYDTSDDQSANITYEELNTRTEQLASLISSEFPRANLRVGILLENSTNFVTILLALFRSGFVAVPISLKATQLHIDTVSQSCTFVICAENTIHLLSKKNNSKLIETLITDSQRNIYLKKDSRCESDEALILYTSGSTGLPKPIIHTHSGLGWKIQTSAQEVLTSNLNIATYLASPIYHMNGMSSLLVMLSSYRTIILTPTFSAKIAANLILEKNVISIVAIPTMISQIISYNRQQIYSSVCSIKLGSAPLTENLLSNIQKYFPFAIIRNNYGLTEVGPNLFGEHPTLPRPVLSVGFPRSNIDYRLVDGILQIKSPSQFKTINSIENSKVTPDGYYVTNDLFRTDENNFYFYLGRADDMIICGGENIYLHSIDRLIESHPSVLSAVTIALTDEVKGSKPYAFVVAKKLIDEIDLVQYLQKYLNKNTTPRKIWFIDEIPVTELGKISRKRLEKMAQENLKNFNT